MHMQFFTLIHCVVMWHCGAVGKVATVTQATHSRAVYVPPAPLSIQMQMTQVSDRTPVTHMGHLDDAPRPWLWPVLADAAIWG